MIFDPIRMKYDLQFYNTPLNLLNWINKLATDSETNLIPALSCQYLQTKKKEDLNEYKYNMRV